MLAFYQNKTWHPAVSMLILQDQPDNMNFVMGGNCTEKVENKCWLKAVLSALDGVLAAEQEKGVVNSTVKLTVSWSEAPRNSIDNVVNQGIGYFGFRDVMVGARDPNGTIGYMPRVGNKTLKEAFEKRWVHSMNAASPYAFLKEKVGSNYNQFLPQKWFIAQWSTNLLSSSDITTNLQAMSADAKADGSAFLGAAVYQFQKEYQTSGMEDGLFDLGDGSAPIKETDKVCEEDVRTGSPRCKQSLPVNCLQQSTDVQRASGVAAAWGGEVKGRGLCPSADVKEVVV